jgi:sucrose-6-phosphate hydrolase SacC (GH32 family)
MDGQADDRTGGRSEATMRSRCAAWLLVALGVWVAVSGATARQTAATDHWTLRDKTFVAWVRLASTEQRRGAVIGLENLPGVFDALVYAEIAPKRWMPGSDYFKRTPQDQAGFAPETAGPDEWVQMAAVYGPTETVLYRNGREYARHALGDAKPETFTPRSIVLFGLRAWESQGEEPLLGSIDDVRIYSTALTAATIAGLRPNDATGPAPLAWWDFNEGSVPHDRMGTFRDGFLQRKARIEGGALHLEGGYAVVGPEVPRTREQEDWPAYHVHVWPDEGLARPYDANGAIFWKGKYHLMYIYQDPARPHGGHCWGHLESTDLVNWTFLPPALRPEPGDKDVGIFSGNAFINKDGRPMLCWFGVDAGVCVATADDDSLVRWTKHPKNPIIPMPKPGEPAHGKYTVWDPYLWLDGDMYRCLMGQNAQPGNGRDTLYQMTSPDLVHWTPAGPFYSYDDLSWTTDGEDCSCPDFFRLGNRHALMCISHKVGGRLYVGRYEQGRFVPEQHVRMNWPGAQFFAPESLEDGAGRRIFWAWVTDPRAISTQAATGSGVMSLPRVLTLGDDGQVRITPVPELESLREAHASLEDVALPDGQDVGLDAARGKCLELALEIDPGSSEAVRLDVRRSADGSETTGVIYEPRTKRLMLDMTRSTKRRDVAYTQGPLDTGGVVDRSSVANPVDRVEAPLVLPPGEPLRLRVFLDGPMLEVFANDRQCLTQQVFPQSPEAIGASVRCDGGSGRLRRLDAWAMSPARFTDGRGTR